MDSRATSLIAVLAVVLLVAWLEAGFKPGEWYLYLPKPFWSLPAWGFMIAWPAFHLLMALGAWRMWLDPGLQAIPPLGTWLATLIAVLTWFWLLFGLHRPGWALAGATVAAALLAVVRTRIATGSAGAARWLTLCLGWLAYVWLWNLAVWRLAGGGAASIFGQDQQTP